MKSKQVDSISTFQARIDGGWWKILSELRTDTRKSFKELIEDALMNTYGIGGNGKPEVINNQDRQAKNNHVLARNQNVE